MNHCNTVRRLVNWAKDNGYLSFDHPGLPRFAGRVKVVPKRVEVYDKDQREKLIAQARPAELPMTLMKAYTPIRAKESGVARWENLDWDVRILTVQAGDAMRGRVMGIWALVFGGMMPVGGIESGLLSQAVGVPWTIAVERGRAR